MRIGQLARMVGVTTSRIRFYEARGIIAPAARTANGYRDYDAKTAASLRFIAPCSPRCRRQRLTCRNLPASGKQRNPEL